MVVPGQTVTRYLKTDRTFDVSKNAGCQVAIHVSSSTFRFALLDEKGTKYIALGDFANSLSAPSAGLAEQVRSFATFLDGVIDAVPWIAGPFGKLRICWEGPHSTLVPASVAVKEEMWEYLAFGHKLEAGETVLSDKLDRPDAFNIFTVPEKTRELLCSTFGADRIYHHTTAFITGMLHDQGHRQGKNILYAWVSGNWVNFAFADKEGLKLQNRFPFSSPEDVIYYLVYILQQFAVEPADAKVVLTGRVAADDGLWKLLVKYVGDPVILSGLSDIHPARDLEDAPVHEWFTALNLFRCGS